MTRYKYTPKAGEFYPGLPAQDLDDATLTPEQVQTLTAGVAAGIYEAIPEEKPAAPVKKGRAAVESSDPASG